MEVITPEQAIENAKEMTFEKFWASLMELRESQKHTEEMIKQTDEQMKKLFKEIGGISNSVGTLIEILIAGKVWEKFANYPYKLERAYRRIKLYDDDNNELTDIDILLVDTDYTMAIEVKSDLDIKDIDHHVKRMSLLRKYPPMQLKVKRLIGAVAGGVVDKEARDYAMKCGFFVLELSGEQAELIEPPDGFKPVEW